MNRFAAVRVVVVCLLTCLLFMGSAYGADKVFIIKLATLAPEGSSWMKTFNTLNAEVMEKTGNKVQFRIYAGGVLGDETDMLRKMKIGQVEAAAFTSGGLSLIYKDIDILQVPFLFQTYEEVDYVLKRMDSYFRKGLEENGYVLLGWSEAGFVYPMSTIPVSGVADLKKAKVWSWEQSPMAKAVFDEAGVKGIPLSIPDVLVGLQTGLVNVVYAPPSGAISLQWFTKVRYLTDVPLAYVAGAVVMNKDAFKRMPPAYQSVLLESSQRLLDPLKRTARSENQEAMKVMMKQGVKIVTPSRQQIDEFKRLSSRAMDHIEGRTFSSKSREEVVSLLQRYRKGLE